MCRPLLITALAAAVASATAADLPTCHLPDADPAACIHVERDATAGQWVLWHVPDSTAVRGRTYPVADGGPVIGMDPAYRWLLAVRHEPPEIDTRLQIIPYPCPESADLTTGILTTTCTAQVRPAAELHGAVANAAQSRISEAMGAIGLRDPADQIRAIALLHAARSGAVLTSAQETWLAGLAQAGVEYVDAVRVVQGDIDAWIDAHPGQMPDIGPAVWPPLPMPVTVP